MSRLSTDQLALELAGDLKHVLLRLDPSPQRPGLAETPMRWAKALLEYTSGYHTSPDRILKTFEDGAEACDQMVLVRDIPFWSLCEHHVAPFFGVAHIAYIPSKCIVGLSKLSRLLDLYARRLQVQERLTVQVATALQDVLKPEGVAVCLEARHTCMESRGIKRAGAVTRTTKLTGCFIQESETRAEFFSAIK